MMRLPTLVAVATCALAGFVPSLLAEEQPKAEATSTEAPARPYLGISLDNSPAAFEGGGVTVQRVVPNTTAAEMGLQSGDRITAINGAEVNSSDAVRAALDKAAVGDDITIVGKRGEEDLSLAGKLQALPSSRVQANELNRISESMRRLQQESGNLQAEMNAVGAQAELAGSMQQLAVVLNALPDQLQQTAEQLKAVYPNGRFSVTIQIDIQTDANDDSAVDLSPEVIAPKEDDNSGE